MARSFLRSESRTRPLVFRPSRSDWPVKRAHKADSVRVRYPSLLCFLCSLVLHQINTYVPFIPQFKQIACLETSNVTEAYNYTVTAPAGGMMPNMTASNSSAAGNSSAYCLSSTLAAIEKISGKSLSFSVISVRTKQALPSSPLSRHEV